MLIIIENARKIKLEIYLCFKNFSKEFDSTTHIINCAQLLNKIVTSQHTINLI